MPRRVTGVKVLETEKVVRDQLGNCQHVTVGLGMSVEYRAISGERRSQYIELMEFVPEDHEEIDFWREVFTEMTEE